MIKMQRQLLKLVPNKIMLCIARVKQHISLQLNSKDELVVKQQRTKCLMN